MAEETKTVELPVKVWRRVQLAIQWESDPELRAATKGIKTALSKESECPYANDADASCNKDLGMDCLHPVNATEEE